MTGREKARQLLGVGQPGRRGQPEQEEIIEALKLMARSNYDSYMFGEAGLLVWGLAWQPQYAWGPEELAQVAQQVPGEPLAAEMVQVGQLSPGHRFVLNILPPGRVAIMNEGRSIIMAPLPGDRRTGVAYWQLLLKEQMAETLAGPAFIAWHQLRPEDFYLRWAWVSGEGPRTPMRIVADANAAFIWGWVPLDGLTGLILGGELSAHLFYPMDEMELLPPEPLGFGSRARPTRPGPFIHVGDFLDAAGVEWR